MGNVVESAGGKRHFNFKKAHPFQSTFKGKINKLVVLC
jgi:hypothetical protein